jgi:hypothetical protein
MDKVVETLSSNNEIVKEVYTDLAKPSFVEIGNTSSRFIDAVLFPLRFVAWLNEQFSEVCLPEIEKRIKKIADDKFQKPQGIIIAPALQYLSYSWDNTVLREMYLNLITSSMDSDKEKSVHPSYVEAIKQMDTLDALLFHRMFETETGQFPVICPSLQFDTNREIVHSLPKWYIGIKIEGYDMFEVSTSLIHLKRLGLIELGHEIEYLYEPIYTDLLDDTDLKEQIEISIKRAIMKFGRNDYQFTHKNGYCYINSYGEKFARCCLPFEDMSKNKA